MTITIAADSEESDVEADAQVNLLQCVLCNIYFEPKYSEKICHKCRDTLKREKK